MKPQCFALAWVEETNGTQPRSFAVPCQGCCQAFASDAPPHVSRTGRRACLPSAKAIAIPLLLKALKACSPAAQSYEIGLECLTLLNDQLL